MIPADKSKAHANPTKAFFVRMITRDITLEDCIFDLIDNSIDGARELEGGHPMTLSDDTDLSAYFIDITINENQFSIKDNCGGITLDDAVNYAFTFGRKDEAEIENYSIGVYGIGMKRAVFKIGTQISIESTFRENGDTISFKVPINVEKWLESKSEHWDFDIEEADHLPEPGVEIKVKDLNEAAKRSFESPRFTENLRRAIGRDYALHLHRGIKIELNGKPIKGWAIELRQSENYAPMRAAFTESFEGEKVNVEVLAGMVAPPPDSSEPNDFPGDQERSGWYVACNGRIVLAADKSKLSGWGTEGWPQWHPQYAGFMGIILFSSRRADLLPLTTTKRNVDPTSSVFLMFRTKMREVTRDWIAYTNARKEIREEAQKKEAEAKPVPIYDVAARAEASLPKLVAKPKVSYAHVNYSVPRVRMRKLAEAFGSINLAYKDVGLKSFEYAFSDLVGDD